MARSVEQRIKQWEIGYDTERVKAKLDKKRPAMLRRVTQAFADLCAMEEQVRQVLSSSGVSTITYVSYLDYGRQVWKLSRQKGVSGTTMVMAAQVLLLKWAARGLEPRVLSAIRTDVFDIAAPGRS